MGPRSIRVLSLTLMLAAPGVDAALAAGGSSNSPYYFFSQPGIAREQVVADLAECGELAGAVQPPSKNDYVYAPTMAGAATVGFLQGMQRGEERRNMIGAAFRKCMAIKGYRRYAMTKDEAKAMFAGSWEDGRARLADAALAPTGDHQRLDP